MIMRLHCYHWPCKKYIVFLWFDFELISAGAVSDLAW